MEYQAYKAGKVLFYLQLLLFSGLAFFLLLPLMRRTLTISLDTDWLWRVVLNRVAEAGYEALATTGNVMKARVGKALAGLHEIAERHFRPRQKEDRERQGIFAQTWSIGGTALWIAVLLTGYMLVYFI